MKTPSLPIHVLDISVAIGEIFSLPSLILSHDWYGKRLDFPVEIYLALAPEIFYFGAHALVMPECTKHEAGAFVEGLWQEDAAEFFIKQRDSSRYQEINLSPCAAWWGCRFNSYRKRDTKPLVPAAVEAWSELGENSWSAAIAIPREYFSPLTLFDSQSEAAVFAIMKQSSSLARSNSTPRAASARCYACLVPGSGEPDFHSPNNFINIVHRDAAKE